MTKAKLLVKVKPQKRVAPHKVIKKQKKHHKDQGSIESCVVGAGLREWRDARLEEYNGERKIYKAAMFSNRRNILIDNIASELWKVPFVIEKFEPGINLRHLLRQACDMTFLTEMLLVLFRQVALKFLRALNTLA